MSFAVIQTGGKQYRVSPGHRIRIEKLDAEAGGQVRFDHVLLLANGDTVTVGTPTVKDAVVEARVLAQGRDDKKIVFKYHSKSRYHKKRGHRQPFTEIEVTKISA